MRKVTLLYSRRANYHWHYEMEGDAAFGRKIGTIINDEYVVVATGEEKFVKAIVGIISLYMKKSVWDDKYIIRNYKLINNLLTPIIWQRKKTQESLSR